MPRPYTRRPWSRRRNQSLAERFWEKVDKRRKNQCWEWRASRHSSGYGMLSDRPGHLVRAHRVSYELAYGPVPDGLFVCHTCDNPPCVNPAHLFAGTGGDNLRDSARKGRNIRSRRPDIGPPRIIASAVVQEVLERLQRGERGSDIARATGLSQAAVSRYKNGSRRGLDKVRSGA